MRLCLEGGRRWSSLLSLRTPTDDGPLRGARLVEAPDRRGVRRAPRYLRILAGLLQDRPHHRREVVETLLGLGLGRLDHERLLDQKREVDGRWVNPVVEHPLGD